MGAMMALALCLLLLGAVPSQGSGSGPHTLHYFYTGVSEPGPRLPQFIAAGYVDGQLIIDYTTKTKNAEPRTEWMARNLDPTYWDQETRIFQVNKARFRDAVETLRNRYNQSKGFHTWQFMAGCELLDGRSTGGYWQYGYDGRDFISLDKETLTWTAADTGAQVTKGKWEADRSLAEYGKWYLEQNCVEELRKYLEYGKETLQRKETPEVKVLAKAAPEGPTTLSCRAHGFYPRNIAVTWVKDGETRDQETQRGGIVPNEDGTYYTWAATEVDPKETDLYTCRVEHESLRKPRDFFWVKDKPNSSLIPIVVGVLAPLALVTVVIIGVIVCRKQSGNSSGQMRTDSPVAPDSQVNSSSADPESVQCDSLLQTKPETLTKIALRAGMNEKMLHP
ncbi:class I histocompatibility antigen, F10 alpha chain-like [Gopherus evgoodei]|uniref:class I histocompatibility antigen, F10 alpha chain-like n=1 Tax=Gopherus evgoodei TaxID=1825980 RepID=UPI0011CEDC7C|nr:class I histocompatibility antigen, F10 alpha chain-like [Gopherus evgoodei]